MRLLLTGFEPFGGSPVNPSAAVVNAIAGGAPRLSVDRVEWSTLILPVVGTTASKRLRAALRAWKPHVLLMLGESAAVGAVSVERVAINLRDYRLPDNAGVTVRDRPVVPRGPAAYFATLPVRRVVEAVRAVGVPAELSLSAGAFLCNEILYAALHDIAKRRAGTIAGFVHLPQLPEQALDARARATMSLETALRAVTAICAELSASKSQRKRRGQ